VEIMVATVIMVAAFFPLVSMMRSGARRAKFQKIRAFGTSLAQNLLERMRGMSIYYLEGSSGAPWYERAEALGHGHLEDDLGDLIGADPIFNPIVGQEGVPDDDEMKDLVERWTKRAELFYVKPHIVSGTWDEPLAARKMAILAVTTSWKEDFQRKDNLQALKDDLSNGVLQGSSSLTMFAIVGEGLFHAASEADPASTP
jgi:hypothetical protein